MNQVAAGIQNLSRLPRSHRDVAFAAASPERPLRYGADPFDCTPSTHTDSNL